MHTFNIDELNSLCSQWQQYLGITHWDIALRICNSHDMPIPNSTGANNISLCNEKALISILDPNDWPDTPFQLDMEVSLVHELLHIPLDYISQPDKNSLEFILLEAFIERIANLLVTLSRKK